MRLARLYLTNPLLKGFSARSQLSRKARQALEEEEFLLEISKVNLTFENLLDSITAEFRCLWTEIRNDFPHLRRTPDFGLKMAYWYEI
jgi:hypothetical protein